jgi:hypothetical protein
MRSRQHQQKQQAGGQWPSNHLSLQTVEWYSEEKDWPRACKVYDAICKSESAELLEKRNFSHQPRINKPFFAPNVAEGRWFYGAVHTAMEMISHASFVFLVRYICVGSRFWGRKSAI